MATDNDDVNWVLLRELGTRSHPNVRDVELPREADPSHWIAEQLTEVRVIHHLCDLAGISRGVGYGADADSRVYLLLRRSLRQVEILGRVADRHARETAPGGLVGDYCVECGHRWPCETNLLATGQLEENEMETRENRGEK